MEELEAKRLLENKSAEEIELVKESLRIESLRSKCHLIRDLLMTHNYDDHGNPVYALDEGDMDRLKAELVDAIIEL